MISEHETYIAFLGTFASAKERVAYLDKERAERAKLSQLDRTNPKAGVSRLLEWTLQLREYEERIVNMGRPRKATPTQAEQLLAALNFVSFAQGEDDWSEFVQLSDKFAIVHNGQVAAGFPIIEELNACPHLERLKIALNRCGKSLVIAETPGNQLSVKGDKLRAVVPCYDPNLARPPIQPDAVAVAVDDRLKAAFKICGTLASEAADDVICASLLLEANQCTGTNRHAMLQVWHGIDLPPHMVLPKIFTKAVADSAYKLTGFGFTWSQQLNAPSSITLWFENGAWLKTQCYNDRWPSIGHLFDTAHYPAPSPEGLFEAIEAVAHFSETSEAYLVEGAVQSHIHAEVGAQYDVPGLQGGKCFNGKLVSQVAPWATNIDLTTAPDRAFFNGQDGDILVRGVLMAKGPTGQG